MDEELSLKNLVDMMIDFKVSFATMQNDIACLNTRILLLEGDGAKNDPPKERPPIMDETTKERAGKIDNNEETFLEL